MHQDPVVGSFWVLEKKINRDLIHDFNLNLFPLMPGLSVLLVCSVEFENSESHSCGPASAGSGGRAQWLFLLFYRISSLKMILADDHRI